METARRTTADQPATCSTNHERRSTMYPVANSTKRMSSTVVRSLALLLTCAMALPAALQAQPGPSFSVSYEYFPSSGLADPDTQPIDGEKNFQQDLEIRIGTLHAEFSAPFVFAEGKTVLVNTLSYHRFDLDYTNWDAQQGGRRIENAQGVEYSLALVRQLSRRWNVTAVATPGIYTDFEDKLSYADFNLQGAVLFGRQHSQNLSYGFGVTYSLKYGQGMPLPLATLQWTNGSNWRVDLFLPVYAELWYLPSRKVEVGLVARVSGSQYHGSPELYAVDDPQLRYSVGTVGPSVKLHLSKGLHIKLDGGVTVLRRFEFFDGDDEQSSLDLKNSGFVRAGLQFGG